MTNERARILTSLARTLVISGNSRTTLGPLGIARIARWQGFDTEQLAEAIEAEETAHSLTLRTDFDCGDK